MATRRRPRRKERRAQAKRRAPARAGTAARSRKTQRSRPKTRRATTRVTARKRSTRRGGPASATKSRRVATPAVREARPKAARKPAMPGLDPMRAARPRHPPGLERVRRQLHEVEENVPTPPSSLDMDRTPSAARSGRHEMHEQRLAHNETSPVLTGGDVDADWQDAYSVGDEAPGGDNPTPDQDVVDDIGKALGVEYQDNEELKAADKITERDRHRWELDPASSDDWKDR